MFNYSIDMIEDIKKLSEVRQLELDTLINNGVVYFRDKDTLLNFIKDNKEYQKYISQLYLHEMSKSLELITEKRGIDYNELLKSGKVIFKNNIIEIKDNKGNIITMEYSKRTKIIKRYYIPSILYDKEVIMFVAYLGKNDYNMKYKNISINDTDKVMGLHQLNYLEDEVYICEGVFDYLRLQQEGVNSVALLGASLSEKVKRIVKRFNKIYLVLDDDSAGEEGVNKIKNRLLSNKVYTREYNFGLDSEVRYKDIDDVLKDNKIEDVVFR